LCTITLWYLCEIGFNQGHGPAATCMSETPVLSFSSWHTSSVEGCVGN